MRTKPWKPYGVALLTSSLLFLAGCSTDLYEPTPEPAPDPTPGPNENTIWPISPTKDYTLTLQYDVPDNYPVAFSVYTQNPLEVGEGGQISLRNIRPVDGGRTDADGYYSEPLIDIQTTVKELYIYTEAVGVPRLLVVKVNGDVLSEPTLPEDAAVETKSLVLRAADDYKTAVYNQFVDGFTPGRLGYWINGNGYYGRPDYLVNDRITVSDKVLKTIRQRLPEGRKPANIDEILANGDIHVTKDARIKIHLIDEYTGANSVMGYYTYPTAQPPTKPAEVEASTVVLFPNAKVPGSGAGGYGAVTRGEGMQLHYFEDGRDKGVVFPAGVSVGWVIYNNGYRPAINSKGKVTNKGNGNQASTFYSTPALNGGAKQVALFRIDQFVVLGMEDWKTGRDYNDIVFHVTADPIDAIIDEIPEVDPEEPPFVPITVNPQGTLAFEDLWPRQGDFDLNDVVVKYNSEITYNENNEVVKTVDHFDLLWSGATIHNAFCYQINARRADVDITFEGEGAAGAYVDGELDLATVRLFNDALAQTGNNTKTTSVTVTTVFRRPYPKSEFRHAPYNPFITTAAKDKEVHLTNYSPTLLAKPGYFGTEDDRSIYGQGTYYITFDTNGIQMPFALHIPTDPDPAKDIPFVIPRESKRIDQFYPKFLSWVTSNGQQDGDWYLYPIDRPEDPAPAPEPAPEEK